MYGENEVGARREKRKDEVKVPTIGDRRVKRTARVPGCKFALASGSLHASSPLVSEQLTHSGTTYSMYNMYLYTYIYIALCERNSHCHVELRER